MILLIDNYDSFTYNLFQAFSILGETVKVIRNDQITVADIAAMDLKGIVLSPGPGRPESAGICIDLIRQLGPRIPMLGVCLGHQAIGAAFEAGIKRTKEVLHGKDSLIFHYRSPLFKDMSLPFRAGRYHSLIVEDLPSALKVEAEDIHGHVMALSHRTYPLFGVQFHPESILTTEGGTLIKNFIHFCENYRRHSHAH